MSCQISGPVVARWAAALAGLANWPGMKAWGISLASSSRLFNGAGHPLGPGGEDQFRPVGGHQQAALHAHGVGHDDDSPVAPVAATTAKPMPVLPEVGSMMTEIRLQQAAGLGVV